MILHIRYKDTVAVSILWLSISIYDKSVFLLILIAMVLNQFVKNRNIVGEYNWVVPVCVLLFSGSNYCLLYFIPKLDEILDTAI